MPFAFIAPLDDNDHSGVRDSVATIGNGVELVYREITPVRHVFIPFSPIDMFVWLGNTYLDAIWQWMISAWESASSVAVSGGSILLAVGLVLVCTTAWLLNLVTLPGNWLAVLGMGLYAWLGPETGRVAIGIGPVIAGFVLGIVGEVFEFAAGAVGASKAGASRRATLYAIGGSMAGAIIGGIVGLPIPVLGPVLAALLFGGMGATAGAMLAEWNDGKAWRDNWRIGRAAFWGRTTGTAGKMVAGLAIVLVCLFSVIL